MSVVLSLCCTCIYIHILMWESFIGDTQVTGVGLTRLVILSIIDNLKNYCSRSCRCSIPVTLIRQVDHLWTRVRYFIVFIRSWSMQVLDSHGIERAHVPIPALIKTPLVWKTCRLILTPVLSPSVQEVTFRLYYFSIRALDSEQRAP